MSELESHVAAAAHGDERAWQRVWVLVEPTLTRVIAQPRFLGRLGGNEDDRRNIIVATMSKLRADGFARLQLYLEARRESPELTFMAWLVVVTKRVGIDYMRSHPDYVRRCDANRSRPGAWVRAGELPKSHLIGRRPPTTVKLTARRIIDQATPTLPVTQRRALQLWTHGEEFGEIAKTLGLANGRAAEKAVRAALDRLRRAHRMS